jgi:hypothetical protein
MVQPTEDLFGFGVIRRRRFVRVALTGATLSVGGYAALRAIGGSAPQVTGLHALSDRHAKTVRAIADTLFPLTGGVVQSDVLERLVFDFDHTVQRMTPDLASQLKLGIMYVELAPVLLDRRMHSFSQLDQAQREQHWRKHWELTDDDLRRAVGGSFRRLMSLLCYDMPSVWPRIHYPGPILAAIPIR